MNKSRFLTVLLPSIVIASAVGASLKGRIVDGLGGPLPGASYKIVNLNDSTLVKQDMTDGEAVLSVDGLPAGRYAMIVEMMGMDPARFNFVINDSTEDKNLGDIRLDDNATMLDETVVVATVAPIVAKQDTLEYNAQSFRTQQNATVEDLLKKLPGVEVGSDGSITSGGKSVTKILVDGKEFFADDPSLATKNLMADMVDKVQVVDRKSDLARLTGVDDGQEETVINLTFKKSLNQGWFGNISGGYGTDKRYQGSANVNYFNNGNQLSIIAGGNNINEMGFGDRGRGRFRDFGANNGITSSQRFGVNFNVGNEEKFRVGGNVFYSYSDRKSYSRSDTRYLYPDRTSFQSSEQNVRDRGHNVRADLRLQWKIDDYNTIDFRPRFNWSSRNSQLDEVSRLFNGEDAMSERVNSSHNKKDNHGTTVGTSGELIYNHNFHNHPGRSFSVQGRYDYSNTHQRTLTWSDLVYYLQNDQDEELFRFLDNDQRSNTASGRLSWTEPLGDAKRGNFIQLSYNIEYKWSNSDKNTYNVPLSYFPGEDLALPVFSSVPQGSDWDKDLSNVYRNRFYTHEIQLGYKKVASNYNLEAGVTFVPSGSQSIDRLNSERNVFRDVFNVAPFANFQYKFSKSSAIRARYRARTSQPSLSALQPVADMSDPLNIIIGNPNLKPTFTQTLMAHFNNFNVSTQASVMAMMMAQMSTNNVTQMMTTDPTTGGRTTTYVNTNGSWNIMGMGMWSSPLRNKSWRLNARMMLNCSTTPGYINGDYNRSANFRISPTAGITYNIDIFQITLNPAYSFQLTTSTLPRQADRYVHSGGFDANAVLQLPFGLELSTDYSFRKTSGYSEGFNTMTNLWNAQISYSVLRDKSLTFSVRAYDLLGQNKNISRTITADRIVDSEYNDLTRYVMFGVAWTFNTMKKKSTSNMPEEFGRGMFPPGPPPGATRGGAPMGPPPGRM